MKEKLLLSAEKEENEKEGQERERRERRLTAILMLLSGFSTLQTKTLVSKEEEAQCFPDGEKRREVIRPVWEAQREEILICGDERRENESES